MKLLIITQKVDRNDPILGFFVRWIEEFSKHCEKLTVICLARGDFDLPKNVKVLSLGKEEDVSRFEYLRRFYKYIKDERDNYDSVFVHMNQEYVLLGALPWKTWDKKIMMWRNHPSGSFVTDLAVYFSDRVFCTSDYSYTAKFKKTEIMPVGVDTDLFKRNESIERSPNSILFLGRISPIKRPDLFVEALRILKKDNVDFTATIVGDSLKKDEQYFQKIKENVSECGLDNVVKFKKSVTNEETIKLYNESEIYVNLTFSGSMDKTIFEAMACENIVLVSNKSLAGKIEETLICEENNVKDLAEKLKAVLALSQTDKRESGAKLRGFVSENHSLKLLGKKLFSEK